jgi:hypothetical protein
LDFSRAPSPDLCPRHLAERSQDWLGDNEDALAEVIGNEDDGGAVRVAEGATDVDGMHGTAHGIEVEGEAAGVVVL